jgi:hypothetical protein
MPLTRPRFEQINSIITTISDPITVLNQGSTAANIDVGFIINRNGGALANTAIFWNESANTFVTAFTTVSGATNANVSISEYANLRVNTLNSTFVNATGNILTAQLNAGQINTTGNIVSGGNVTVGNMIVPTGAGRFNGPFNESTTIAGVYVGNLNLSPRIGFFNGTAAQNWQIDNNFGAFRWYTPGVVRLSLDANGNLNIPSSSPSTSTTTGALVVTGGVGIGGNLFVGGALTESSSATLKENIIPIDGALDLILQLTGVIYDRKDGSRKNEAGLIAEEVNKILPNLISTDEQGTPMGVQYTKLTAYLIEAVKSLKAEIDQLKKRD